MTSTCTYVSRAPFYQSRPLNFSLLQTLLKYYITYRNMSELHEREKEFSLLPRTRNSHCHLSNWQRYSINLCDFLTSQHEALHTCWQQSLVPLTACWHRPWRRYYHQHVLMPLDHTHHCHCAPFFHVPFGHMQNIIKWMKKKSDSEWQLCHGQTVACNKQFVNIHLSTST